MFFCYLNCFVGSQECHFNLPEPILRNFSQQKPFTFLQFFAENQREIEASRSKTQSKAKESENVQKKNKGLDKRKKKNTICKEKEGEEEEYMPKKYNQKPIKKQIKQDIRRNIVPNIVHQLFCFIQKKSRSYKIVQRYFLSAKNINFSVSENVSRFYNYQKLLKNKTNNYMNFKGLEELKNYQETSFEIYSKKEQQQFLKLNRILIRHFVSHQLNLIIMTSLRMKNWSREYYLEAKRKIYDYLQQELQIL